MALYECSRPQINREVTLATHLQQIHLVHQNLMKVVCNTNYFHINIYITLALCLYSCLPATFLGTINVYNGGDSKVH